MVDLVKEWGGAPQSTIIGHGMKVPTPHAALVNAMMGHGVELDDAHGTGLIKAGSVLVPSAFAVAELSVPWPRPDHRDRCRLRRGDPHCQGHQSGSPPARVSYLGHSVGIGAAAMSAKLLGCSVEQIASAIGLACMQSAGIQSYLDDLSSPNRSVRAKPRSTA